MRFEFEHFTLKPLERELTRQDESVPVEPLVFDLLLHLVSHRDRVVSKDELVDEIWRGRAISDATLSSCVKSARRALDDDGRVQRFIKTYHRRGFRFVAPVSVSDRVAVTTSGEIRSEIAPEPDNLGHDALSFGIDLTLPTCPSIAVLPFTIVAGDEKSAVFARGLDRDITLSLVRTRWLFVSARESSARFDARAVEPAEIGRLLGVRYLLNGTFAHFDSRFRLTVGLIDTTERREVWSERYDRALGDIFAIQDEIGDMVASAVESEIDLRERRRAALVPMESLDAWSAYHRANDLLFRFSPDTYDEAERLLALATRADPLSARIAAASSFLSWQRAFLEATPDRDGEIRRAYDLAQHAVSLDPHDGNAHWSLGRASLLMGQHDQAVDEMHAAVALSPNAARAQYALAWSRRLRDGNSDVMVNIDKARRLSPYDPFSFAFMNLKGDLHLLDGDRSSAVDWSSRAVRLTSNQLTNHHQVFANAARIHEAAGHHEVAKNYLDEVRKRRPGYGIAEYFRAFPFGEKLRPDIEKQLRRLGLR